MTSNPYTPDEAELIGCYAGAMEEQAGENYATAKADAERGIANVKADALREAAAELRGMEDEGPYVTLSEQVKDGWGIDCGEIDQGYADWLRVRADRIEANDG